MSIKVCKICSIEKDIVEFRIVHDYHINTCIECERKKCREYKEKNKEEIKIKKKISDKLYREKNKEKLKIKKKLYCEKNKENKKTYDRKYIVKNKERIRKQKKIYYENNKEKFYFLSKLYNENNKDKMRLYHANYVKYRRQNDLDFHMLSTLRRQLNCALKRNQKSGHTLDLLGCSIEQFKQHLESLFKEGMTWENYGYYGWHIDHILPCSAFELQNSEEQEICFHYTNLQPLWRNENLIKKDKIIL